MIFGMLQDIRLLISAPKSCVVIYAFNNFFSLYFINKLSELLKKRVVICCHSELTDLIKNNRANFFVYRLRSYIFRIVFLEQRIVISKKLFFLVLGDSILFNLKKIVPENKANNFFALDHPYIFNSEMTQYRPSQNKDKVKVGWVGLIAGEKGAYDLVRIANDLKLKKRDDLELCVVGRVVDCQDILKDAGVVLTNNLGNEIIPRDVFNYLIDSLDYIIFLYPSNSYSLAASGSFFDSLNMKKPIIGIRNNYFGYINDKFGHFGYLVDSISEIPPLIEELIVKREYGTSDLTSQKIDLVSLQRFFTPDILSRSLKKQLLDKGLI
jgi:glycosyltransferase involved in cell wall biosynthesis